MSGKQNAVTYWDDAVQGWALPGLLFALGPVLVLAPRATVIELALLAVVALVLGARGRVALTLPPQTVMTLFFLLFIWAAVTSIWTVAPLEALSGAGKQVAFLVAGCLTLALLSGLSSQAIQRSVTALVLGAVVMLGLFAIDVHGDYVISNELLNRNVTVPATNPFIYKMLASALAVLVWPVMALVYGRGHGVVVMILIWVAALYMIYIGNSRAAMVAFVLGTAWVGLIMVHRRYAVGFLIAAMAVLFMTFPFLFMGIEDLESLGRMVASSMYHRFMIWDFVIGKIGMQPWFGWGMQSSPFMEGGHGIVNSGQAGLAGENLPLHPHNGILQIWLELGLIGAILATVTLVVVLRRAFAAAPTRFHAALIGGQASAGFIVVNVSFSIWQSWWVAALWLSVVIMALALKSADGGQNQTP